MGSWSIGHWVIVLIIILLLFGAGKIPALMSDIAKGVKAFRKGMAESDTEEIATTNLSVHKNQCSEEINKDHTTS